MAPSGRTAKGTFAPGNVGNPDGRNGYEPAKGGLSVVERIVYWAKRGDLPDMDSPEWRALLNIDKGAVEAVRAYARGEHKFLATFLERLDGKVPEIINTNTVVQIDRGAPLRWSPNGYDQRDGGSEPAPVDGADSADGEEVQRAGEG